MTKETKTKEYKAGFDCGKNGANVINCHFTFFSTPEKTKRWENGYKKAKNN